MNELIHIQDKIYEIRGQRVMLDFDLAGMYQVKTSMLNQSVRRNTKRFPIDFMFQLTNQEFANLMSQIVTSNRGGTRKLPYAFTEQGVAMLSGLLNSDIAINVNIGIMRAFVQMRNYLSAHSAAVSDGAVSMRLLEMERKLDQVHELWVRLDMMEQSMIAQAETQSRRAKAIKTQSKSPVMPECFSESVRVLDYSARAVVVVTRDVEDQRLLISIGARHNDWLTWNGERIEGWVFPKSRMDTLIKYLPESMKDWQNKRKMS